MFRESIYNLQFKGVNHVYLYNTLSGELIKVDEKTLDYITGIQKNNRAEDYVYFQALFDKGFIVNAQLDEYARVMALKNELLYSSQSSRVSYVIALTTECNYRCIYCYEEGCNIGRMAYKTANSVVRFIMQEAQKNNILKTINITWFGGEPLLAAECIALIGEQINKYCSKRNINFTTNIITNGYFLTPERLLMLKKYNLQNIQITVDGLREDYNRYKKPNDSKAYDKVVDNIKHASKTTKVTIRLNCSNDNYGSIKEFCKYIVSLTPNINMENIIFSISKINMGPEKEISNEMFSHIKLDFISFLAEMKLDKQLKAYLPNSSVIPCGLMKRTNFVIDNNGFLYKCEHFIGRPEYSVGSVSEGLLYPKFQRAFEETPFMEQCRSCAVFPVCRGGCSQKRYAGTSSVSCKQKKEEVLTILHRIVGE